MEYERVETTGTLVFRLIYPYLVYLGISLVVELMIVMPHCLDIINDSAGLDYYTVMNMVEDYIYSNALMLTAISSAFCAPVLYLFYARDRKYWPVKEFTMYKKQPAVKYLYVILFGVIISLAYNSLFELFSVSEISDGFNSVSSAIESSPVIWQILATVVAAPVVEELVFRGLIYKRLRRHYNAVLCALVSSIVFGITHGNIVQFLYAFIVGMALAYVFEKYNNLWAPILLHAMANLTAVTIAGVIADIDNEFLRVAAVAIEIALSFGAYKLIEQKVTQDKIMEENI